MRKQEKKMKKSKKSKKITMEAASVLLGTSLMMGLSSHTAKADNLVENESENIAVLETNNVEEPASKTTDTQETLTESADTTDDSKTEEVKNEDTSKAEEIQDTNENLAGEIPDKKEETLTTAEELGLLEEKKTTSNKLHLDVSNAQIKVEVAETAKDDVKIESENEQYNEYAIAKDKIDGDFLHVIYTDLNKETNKYISEDGEIEIGKIEITFSDYEGKGFDDNYLTIYKLDKLGEFLTNAKNVTISIKLYDTVKQPQEERKLIR